ncbi:hypothetical protein HGI79_14430 [Clostridium sp. DJ247]|nr:hypothetical protein [Clostridium sp. DJ247]
MLVPEIVPILSATASMNSVTPEVLKTKDGIVKCIKEFIKYSEEKLNY